MVIRERYIRLAKEGSWIVIGQIVTVAGALLLVRVLTEYLDPEHYGQLALGLTVASLVNQMVTGGIGNAINRFYPIATEKHDLEGYLYATRQLLVWATLVVALVGLIIIAGLLWLGYSHWIGLVAAALVLAVLTGYNGACSGIQNAARQRAIVAFHSGLDAWLKILLALGTIACLGATSLAVVIGYALSLLLITFSQLIFLRGTLSRQQPVISDRQQWIHQMWSYSLPFSIFGGFTWLQLVSDRWALQAFATGEQVGQYAVLFQLGYSPIALITAMATNFLGPILYQRAGDATDHARNANVHRLSWGMTYISLAATLVGFAITSAAHEWLFGLLVAQEYRGSSYLLPWVVLAGGIFAAGQLLALKLLSEMKSSAMTKAKIVTALIGLILNVVGAIFAGIQGVVGALVAFSVTYFFWMAMLSRRVKH